MQIINLRHPGYPDSSNIILTLQAPDDPNGGIHAETLRLAGCIIAGNRWDGYLSITQDHPKPVVPDHDGVLRRKDYYFHLPSVAESIADEVIDRRKQPEAGPWPVVARFADWEWPAEGLPEIWKLAAEAVDKQKSNSRADGEKVVSHHVCRLCGQEEDVKYSWLWDAQTSAEHQIFERETTKILIASELDADYSDDEETDESGSDVEADAEPHSEEALDTDDKASADQSSVDSDDEDLDQIEHVASAVDQVDHDHPSSQSDSGADLTEELATPEKATGPLNDDRNILLLGEDCSTEPEHCEICKAHDRYQWLFVPKFEQDGEPILSAHIFATRENGITLASHDKPLVAPWRSSVEMLFAHFVQAVFEQLEPFFASGVERVVKVIDVDGKAFLLDADTDMCKTLTVASVTKFWPVEEDSDKDKSDDDDSSADDQSSTEEMPDGDAEDSDAQLADEQKADVSNVDDDIDQDSVNAADDVEETGGTSDIESEKAAVRDGDTDELVEIAPNPEDFAQLMTELNELLLEDTSEAPRLVAETVVKRAFPDVFCDGCEGEVFDTRYKCLDCDNYDLCLDCIDDRAAKHPAHHFLPIHEGGWRRKVPTGNMIPRDTADGDEASSSSSDESDDDDEVLDLDHELTASQSARLLATHMDVGTQLQYAESLVDTSASSKIRLLHLWPGAPSTAIMGHLETVTLSEAPTFEALSYCWGNPEPRQTINISGARLEVTTNLKLALYHLRKPGEVRPLWIDGICINQSDDVEKGAQVMLMRQIYEKAEQTIVWLGEEKDNSRLALDMCERMLRAHGNTYIRQTMGVDVEQLFEQAEDDEVAPGMLDEATLQRTMTNFSNDFDLSLVHYNIGLKAAHDIMQGKTYEGPFKAEIEKAVAEELAVTEGIDWEDVGRRLASGEDYTGPHKELVDATFAETMAELEAEGDDGDDAEAEEVIETEGTAVSNMDDQLRSVSSSESEECGSVQWQSSSGSKYHQRMILQILEARRHGIQDQASTEPPSTAELTALYALFERPWFSRIWIVQEAGVSSQILVQCGSRIIDWWTFSFGYLITQKLSRNARIAPKSHRNLVVMSNTRSYIHTASSDTNLEDAQSNLSLLSLLSSYRGYLATDPRDKVFALLGIAASDLDLVPDYTKSYELVFTDVATRLLNRSSTLDVLASCHANGALPKTLPSWVPNWSDLSRKPYKLAGNLNFESSEASATPLRVFRASQDSVASIQIDDGRLHTQGLVLDTVAQVAEALRIEITDLRMPIEIDRLDDSDMEGILSLLRRFFSVFVTFPKVLAEWQDLAHISDSENLYSTGEDNFTVFARTLWADLEDPNTCVANCKEWLDKLRWMTDMAEAFPSSLDIDPTGTQDEKIMSLMLKFMPFLQGLDPSKMKLLRELSCVHTLDRRLGRTAGGLLCLLPAEAKIGDSIALLQGGATPYVLRAAGEEYTLVGEAYVHGIMYGEAWELDRCEDICIV